MEQKIYRLFATEITEKNVEQAEKKRFSRISAEYILIYDNGRKPTGSVEITADDLWRLTQRDKVWLQDCNLALLLEMTQKHETEIAKGLSERLEQLETELRREKESMKTQEGA